jgi:putative transcriptional regulator
VNKPPLIEKGSLLIATPNLTEPLYKQSVVLICEYTNYGSFGLMINKPYIPDAKDPSIELDEILGLRESLRIGGSMQQNQLMLIHASKKSRDQTLKITDGVYLGGDFSFLQDLIRSEPEASVLICFGYTGWSTGELEKQLDNGLWYTHPSSKSLIFETPPEQLWKETLTSMGGIYKNISLIPGDLTLN